MHFSPGRPWSRDPAWVPGILIVLLLAIRALLAARFQLDLDEPQHLHIVHGWLSGELPYRDRFDNHAPLFGMLFVPLAAWIGESPWIVTIARLAMIPVQVGLLAVIYLLARLALDRTTALWALAVLLVLADWSLKAVEVRPDVLWALLWFASLYALVARPRPGIGQVFTSGFLLGAALCVSIKTLFLAPALAIGFWGAWLFQRERVGLFAALRLQIVGLIGFLLAPALLLFGLSGLGISWPEIRFCLFDVNRVPFEIWRVAGAVVLGLAVLPVAWWLVRREKPEAWSDGVVFLASAAFSIALFGFSPETRKQTLLVVYPVAVIFGVRVVFSFLQRFRPAWIRPVVFVVWTAFFGYFLYEARPWSDGLAKHRDLLAATIRLTEPGDYLMDGRGETVFADRPVFLAYVATTLDGIENRGLTDADPEDLARTQTAFAIGRTSGMSKPMRAFLRRNYLPLDGVDLRVAGQILKPTWVEGRWIDEREIKIPGQYVVVRDGVVEREVHIDSAGLHLFDLGTDRRPALLVWRKAWMLGYRPDPNLLGEISP